MGHSAVAGLLGPPIDSVVAYAAVLARAGLRTMAERSKKTQAHNLL